MTRIFHPKLLNIYIETHMKVSSTKKPGTHKKHPKHGNKEDNHHDEITSDDQTIEPMFANWSLL
jgi:hypothetical protein